MCELGQSQGVEDFVKILGGAILGYLLSGAGRSWQNRIREYEARFDELRAAIAASADLATDYWLRKADDDRAAEARLHGHVIHIRALGATVSHLVGDNAADDAVRLSAFFDMISGGADFENSDRHSNQKRAIATQAEAVALIMHYQRRHRASLGFRNSIKFFARAPNGSRKQ